MTKCDQCFSSFLVKKILLLKLWVIFLATNQALLFLQRNLGPDSDSEDENGSPAKKKKEGQRFFQIKTRY